MSHATDAQKETVEYQLGYADGMAENQPNKWKAILGMWGGLGFFIIVLLICGFPQSLYQSYQDNQLKQEKIQACGHAPDVVACIQAVTD